MAPQDESKTPKRRPNPGGVFAGYTKLSAEPLHVLVFLLPLVALYEYGSLVHLSDPDTGQMQTISAHRAIATFFEAFGVVGFHLPAVALVTVLLVWHVLSSKPWRVHLPTLLGMTLESLLWTAPLIVMAIALQGVGAGDAAPAAASTDGSLHDMPYLARLTIAIGAGLYEELLFRMIAIAGLHFLLVDVARLKPAAGSVLAVVISGLAFAFYHDLTPGGGGFRVDLLLFFVLSGLFFGFLYLGRGFGIPVAVHVLYDVFALSSGG